MKNEYNDIREIFDWCDETSTKLYTQQRFDEAGWLDEVCVKLAGLLRKMHDGGYSE